MNLHLNRTALTRVYLAILQALDAPDVAVTSDDHMRHAYAEACTHPYPEEAFALSRAIDAFVAGDLHDSGYDHATVDPSALNEDMAVVSIALRLAGFRRVSGSALWSDAPFNERTLHIKFPESFEL